MGTEKRLPEKLPEEYERAFPNLKDYVITSPCDPCHNCIAFAAGNTSLWWEPLTIPKPGYYWPEGAFRENENDDIDALKRCFSELGFKACENGEMEVGYKKVALFAINKNEWTHAAVQDENGNWSSKLGDGYDIRHNAPECVAGPNYGTVACFMKLAIAKTAIEVTNSEEAT